MMKKIFFALALLAAAAWLAAGARAAEPSLHEVYQAAESGKLRAAQDMMSEVLRAHPNSGKAHYVEAELLAKSGRFAEARGELAKAESLAPGLPFAKPQAVENLRVLLASRPPAAAPLAAGVMPAAAAAHDTSLPWGMIVGGLGLLALAFFASRALAQRRSVPAYAGGQMTAGPAGQPSWSSGPAYGGGVQEPGLGSRVLGGLATGAAVGAGVVAGEALMHRFFDHPGDSSGTASRGTDLGDAPGPRENYFNDLGGSDFGVSDTSSWDDAGGGDSDWN